MPAFVNMMYCFRWDANQAFVLFNILSISVGNVSYFPPKTHQIVSCYCGWIYPISTQKFAFEFQPNGKYDIFTLIGSLFKQIITVILHQND